MPPPLFLQIDSFRPLCYIGSVSKDAYPKHFGWASFFFFADRIIAIRRCAVQNGVNMFTSLDTARILLDALEEVIPEISTIHR